MIRKNTPKQTKKSFNMSFWAIIFVEPSSLQIRNVEMLMATTLSHSVAKIFPQGGCIMKMAWTYGILWPRGTLNKIVECLCHPGTLIISGHLLDASSKTKWTRLKERQTNRDRKHHLEVQVPCLCAWIPKRITMFGGKRLFFRDLYIIHGATKNRRKIRKKTTKNLGIPSWSSHRCDQNKYTKIATMLPYIDRSTNQVDQVDPLTLLSQKNHNKLLSLKLTWHLQIDLLPKRKRSYSNLPFSGANC